jgi:hypothetical protein
MGAGRYFENPLRAHAARRAGWSNTRAPNIKIGEMAARRVALRMSSHSLTTVFAKSGGEVCQGQESTANDDSDWTQRSLITRTAVKSCRNFLDDAAMHNATPP